MPNMWIPLPMTDFSKNIGQSVRYINFEIQRRSFPDDNVPLYEK